MSGFVLSSLRAIFRIGMLIWGMASAVRMTIVGIIVVQVINVRVVCAVVWSIRSCRF